MVRTELLAVLAQEAGRLGTEPISDRRLEDWIMEGFLDGPSPKGRKRGVNPEWQYTEKAVTAALAVVRLRAAGIRRATATRIQLFLTGFDIRSAKIKGDLNSEFDRLMKKNFFRKPWVYDASVETTDNEKNKQLRRAGALDPVFFEAGFQPHDRLILDVGSAYFWGQSGAETISSLLENVIAKNVVLPAEIKSTPLRKIRPYVDAVGFLGNPDEIGSSGMSDLQRITEAEIAGGREFYSFTMRLFKIMARMSRRPSSPINAETSAIFKKIESSFRGDPEWATLLFALGAVVAFRQRAR